MLVFDSSVVNSGTGLHLYYVLKEPVPMYPYNQKCLKELKYSLTRQIWNKFTSTIKEPQMQGILQGFRVVGSGSKLGREYPVRAFRLGGPVELARLLDYIPDSNGEQQRLEGLMRKSRLSLAEAKEKYPDWYERRIIKKERRGRWTVKRDLYDWWLHRIADEIRVGHRFYGIMTLAIYAKKCGIDEDELRRPVIHPFQCFRMRGAAKRQEETAFRNSFGLPTDPFPTLLASDVTPFAFWYEGDPEGGCIRFLTETESERLMGLPEGWTKYGADGVEIRPLQRYKALGNAIALPCADYIMAGIYEVLADRAGKEE